MSRLRPLTLSILRVDGEPPDSNLAAHRHFRGRTRSAIEGFGLRRAHTVKLATRARPGRRSGSGGASALQSAPDSAERSFTSRRRWISAYLPPAADQELAPARRSSGIRHQLGGCGVDSSRDLEREIRKAGTMLKWQLANHSAEPDRRF